MISDFVLLALIGFVAQLVDGALGMAFGVISTSAMLAMGLPPAHASAVVHTAEIFTTSASAGSHIWHRNVEWRLAIRLAGAGAIGAALGAWLLSSVDSAAARPLIALYLLAMGFYILLRAWRLSPARSKPAKWVSPVGFIAGFLDASGGGGWGPVTASTLISSGHTPRMTVGSVNTAEFFVTTAAATTFFVALGFAAISELIALVVGGVLAAPLGGWMVKRIPAPVLMCTVGIVLIILSGWQLTRWLKLI